MSEHIKTDVVIVGAGIAGLMAAIKCAPLEVIVICKNRLGSGAATDWAQGGIAAAVGPDDSPILHSMDTQRAGAGIANRSIVDILTRDAPARIEELLELGAHFDRTARAVIWRSDAKPRTTGGASSGRAGMQLDTKFLKRSLQPLRECRALPSSKKPLRKSCL